MKPRLAVLLSGGGTTLQNLLDRIADGRLDAEVVHVVSSKAAAFGLERARHANIPTTVVIRKSCPTVEDFSARVFEPCGAADLVCMAGFLQLVTIPAHFRERV